MDGLSYSHHLFIEIEDDIEFWSKLIRSKAKELLEQKNNILNYINSADFTDKYEITHDGITGTVFEQQNENSDLDAQENDKIHFDEGLVLKNKYFKFLGQQICLND